MSSNQDVQEVLNTLTNTITAAGVSSESSKAFVASFHAAMAQHNAERDREVALAVVTAAAEASANATSNSEAQDSQDSERLQTAPIAATIANEQQQQDGHEELQRIAEQHQQEIKRQELRDQPEQSQDQAAQSQEEQHRQVIQNLVAAATEASNTLATVPITKPTPGSEEWHRMRRDNHKEVERRRRETINDGINDLAKLIPSNDKNKGSILREAVKYIQGLLVDNERLTAEVELLTATKLELNSYILEKSVAEATYQSLNIQHQQLKREYEELGKKMEELEPNAAKKQRTE